jgi:hypothetical protein
MRRFIVACDVTRTPRPILYSVFSVCHPGGFAKLCIVAIPYIDREFALAISRRFHGSAMGPLLGLLNKIRTDYMGFIFASATLAHANPDNARQDRAYALNAAAAQDSVHAFLLKPGGGRAAPCRGPES